MTLVVRPPAFWILSQMANRLLRRQGLPAVSGKSTFRVDNRAARVVFHIGLR